MQLSTSLTLTSYPQGCSELYMLPKYSTMISSILSSSSCHFPSASKRPSNLFFHCLCVAVACKNFVFRSPHFIHKALDLWLHITSSFVRTALISFFRPSISSAVSCSILKASSSCNLFCFTLKVLLTLPKTSLFQLCKWS
ncbi:hypothetical protein ACJW30_11G053700 [Castanea mollissima]